MPSVKIRVRTKRKCSLGAPAELGQCRVWAGVFSVFEAHWCWLAFLHARRLLCSGAFPFGVVTVALNLHEGGVHEAFPE